MKLIRDKYADIIASEHLDNIEGDTEKNVFLVNKLEEELSELSESHYKDVYEYADVIEVLYALAELNGISKEELETARKKKLDEKGGFNDGLILLD